MSFSLYELITEQEATQIIVQCGGQISVLSVMLRNATTAGSPACIHVCPSKYHKKGPATFHGRWKDALSLLPSCSQGQWEWLTNQASARSNQINELLARLGQFNQQYDALRGFVREGNDLLGREKPVGSSAARIHEQMETCQVGVTSQ